uniref:Lysosome-associated membrane glycoprotein 5 n=1 Tax=Caenorhabditis tropicalis TaxID=1561998 RepID=A0A1I7T5L0_9PELO
MGISRNLSIFLLVLAGFVQTASDAANKGIYKVVDSNGVPCIVVQADIYLYLTYTTSDSEKDVVVHVPTSSKADTAVSSCHTTINTAGMSIDAQLLRINLDHMEGWIIDFAFTKDSRFKTENGKEYAMFQVNVTANYASDKKTFPDAKYPTQNYYLHLDPNDLSDIGGSIFADVGNSYYCPSEQKYAINDNDKYGPMAYIKFKLTTLQAYMSSSTFGPKTTCPTDQSSTDLLPIIVGSALAGLIVLTLVVYLIYRTFLPEEVLNLVNPDSHFDSDSAEGHSNDNESVLERF